MKIIITAILAVSLTACSFATTTYTSSDGIKTTASGFEFGNTQALTGLSDQTTKDGRSIGVQSVNNDVNVQALQAGTASLGTIIGAAVKAYAASNGVPAP